MDKMENPTKTSTVDVYNLLYYFVKKKRKAHIFVDEMPILHFKSSKKLISITIKIKEW